MKKTLVIFCMAILFGCGLKQHTIFRYPPGGQYEVFDFPGTGIRSDSAFYHRTPFIRFDSAAGKMTGNSGCNMFSTSYFIQGDSLIISDRIVMTKMFCEGRTEKLFFEALGRSAKISRKEDHIFLMRNGDTAMVLVQSR